MYTYDFIRLIQAELYIYASVEYHELTPDQPKLAESIYPLNARSTVSLWSG